LDKHRKSKRKITIRKKTLKKKTVVTTNGSKLVAEGTYAPETAELEDVINMPLVYDEFFTFLQKKLASDKLELWTLLVNYSRYVDEKNLDKSIEILQKVWEDHLSRDALKPISISNFEESKLLDAIQMKTFEPYLFVAAQFELEDELQLNFKTFISDTFSPKENEES